MPNPFEDFEGRGIDEILPPHLGFTAAAVFESLEHSVAPQLSCRLEEKPETAEQIAALAQKEEVATYSLLVRQMTERSVSSLKERVEIACEKGPLARAYAGSIIAAATTLRSSLDQNHQELGSRLKSVEDFREEFTNGYTLGTVSGLLAAPTFLIVKALGIWSLLSFIGISVGISERDDSSMDPVLQLIVWEIALGIFAALLAIATRGFLMRHRLRKLPTLLEQKRAHAYFQFYSACMRSYISSSLELRAALRNLRADSDLELPEDCRALLLQQLINLSRERDINAAKAGISVHKSEGWVAELGMTGEEDTLVTSVMDLMI